MDLDPLIVMGSLALLLVVFFGSIAVLTSINASANTEHIKACAQMCAVSKRVPEFRDGDCSCRGSE